MATKAQQQAKAIECMKQLDIYKPYIEGFEKENQVCLYEAFAGFWVHQYEELNAKMKQIEKRFKATVYAITHEFMEFGECYTFLLVPFIRVIGNTSSTLKAKNIRVLPMYGTKTTICAASLELY